MMIIPRAKQAEEFFARYSRLTNDALQGAAGGHAEELAASFAGYFVGAGPTGVAGGANDGRFADAIREGFERYRRLGGTALTVTRVKVTELDDFNAMVRVDWDFAYTRPDGGRRGNIAFQNVYFLNFATGAPKIFAWVSPDEEQAMRDHGLL